MSRLLNSIPRIFLTGKQNLVTSSSCAISQFQGQKNLVKGLSFGFSQSQEKTQEKPQETNEGNKEKVNFGYKKVNMDEKQGMVNEVFDSVANKYDLMNDVMSMGVHRCWKDYFVSDIGFLKPGKLYQENTVIEKAVRVLDVAGGTGDISFRILEKHKEERTHVGAMGINITCLDINEGMLENGKQRAKTYGYSENEIKFVKGDAENLKEFEDNTFDLYTISFGLRNVPNTEKALKEAFRVLKKGGRFMCLEFSKIENQPANSLYKFYSFNVIPLMGKLLVNDSASYQYLAESIEKFYDQQTLLKMVENAGFQFCSYKNLSLGVCAIHSGFKL